ncbi:hypothetical protein JSY14_09125 [Brachybacterium sp. EF45031]|uniref:hypothetical protein n=1 Tax=Brachybacterium sillae TaxID=2810536 RepID=UPI00217DC6A7|nr:hypothetical protein [Brachybacterium sillae]MCS6712176.1 hypothetical protein [Brachybacterium sillae]
MQGSRVVSRGAAVGTVLLVFSACGGFDTPLPAEDAVAHYDDVATTVADAAAPEASWNHAESTRHVTAEDPGTCRYTPGDWSMDGPLISRDGRTWDDLIGDLGPSLEKAGFDPVDAASEQASRRVLETTDAHGATLQLTEDGRMRIHSALVDADACTESALGID